MIYRVAIDLHDGETSWRGLYIVEATTGKEAINQMKETIKVFHPDCKIIDCWATVISLPFEFDFKELKA